MMSLALYILAQAASGSLSKVVIALAALFFILGVSLLIYFFRRLKKGEQEPEEDWNLSMRSLFVDPASAASQSAGSDASIPQGRVQRAIVDARDESEPLEATGTRELGSRASASETPRPATSKILSLGIAQPVQPKKKTEPAISKAEPTISKAEAPIPAAEPASSDSPRRPALDATVWAELAPTQPLPVPVDAAPPSAPSTAADVSASRGVTQGLSSEDASRSARVETRPAHQRFEAPPVESASRREPFEPPRIEPLAQREPFEPPQIEPVRPPAAQAPVPVADVSRSRPTQGLTSNAEAIRPATRPAARTVDAVGATVAPGAGERLPDRSPSSLPNAGRNAESAEPAVAIPGGGEFSGGRKVSGSVLGLPAETSAKPLILGDPTRGPGDAAVNSLSHYGREPEEPGGQWGAIILALIILLVGGAVVAYLLVPSFHSRVRGAVGHLRGEDAEAARLAALKPKAQIIPNRTSEVNKNIVKARGQVINISDHPLEGLTVEISLERGNATPPDIKEYPVTPAALDPGAQGTYEFEYDGKRGSGYIGYKINKLVSKDGDIKFATPGQNK